MSIAAERGAPERVAPRYDLLVRAARVLDPAHGIDGPLEIGISAGRIVATAPNIAPGEAARTISISGADRVVVPGLIDLHAHVAVGATTPGLGIAAEDPDVIGVSSGVTTVVDGGSVGVANFGAIPRYLIPNARTRIVWFANLGSHAHTLPGRPDITSLDDIDAAAIRTCVDGNPGLIRGFKLRLVGPFVEQHGERVIERSLEVARAHGLPLMVHVGYPGGDATRMRDLTRELLRALGHGDILTHLCTSAPGGILDERGAPLPEVAAARANGVVLDTASGRSNFAFDVARRQAAAGLAPDTISTDLTIPTRLQIVHGLLEVMAKFIALGYGLPDVVRMVTSGPARALGMEKEIGTIAPGREADLTVFDLVVGRWRFVDTEGQSITGTHALVPVLTIRRGVMVPPDWGPYPRGWLPDEA